jgi:hypothetical protein
LRLTDYKAGKPISDAKKPETRREKLLEEIAAGRRLQAAAYALGGGSGAEGSEKAVGRYLFASPDLGDGPAVQELDSGDLEARERFEDALRILFGVWENGSFFPRLVDATTRSEPGLCETCRVSEACLRGDSGARARLLRWLERASAPDARRPLDPAEAALLEAWRIEEARR